VVGGGGGLECDGGEVMFNCCVKIMVATELATLLQAMQSEQIRQVGGRRGQSSQISFPPPSYSS